MRLAQLASCFLMLSVCSGHSVELSLDDSMEYAKALRLVLALPATHVKFNSDGAVTSISCPGKFDDRVANVLSKFPHLRELRFQSNELTSLGFRQIGKVVNLELLSVGDVSLTDDDLLCLSALPKLASLELSFAAKIEEGAISKLTDHAIEALGKCTALTHLVLSHSRISKEALGKLQKMLPKAKVIADD